MSSPTDDPQEKERRLLSLDEWAVAAALVLALLVRAGVLTRVPW